ncbi:MAG: phage tail tape measure protein [Eubacteriales bacterium]|nr:phage tail tape measure protein [Eubacteriales bacterium]
MAELGKAYVQIVPSAKGISGAIEKVLNSGVADVGGAAGSTIGGNIGSFAVKAVAALGVGKAISDSISNGMDFENVSAKASTLFSGTAEEFKNFQDEIKGISDATGVAASQLMEAAYSAESASVPMGNLGSMIEASSKLAVSGFTDIDTALSATAKTMNAYGMVTDDVNANNEAMEKVQRVLIQTQNKGITTVGELGASLANVTPTAASAGVSFEQVGAGLALMTAKGTPTAQATTQLRSAIAELEKSGTKASVALEQAAQGTEYAGMSFTEMMASGADLSDVMDMLQQYADASGLSMLDLWSSIEGGNAAMAIASDVQTFKDDLDAMGTSADVVGDAYSTMSETASFKLEKLKNTLTNMGIDAFAASADLFTAALEGLQTVIDLVSPSASALGDAFMTFFAVLVDNLANLFGIETGFSTAETAAGLLNAAIGTLTDVISFLTENMDTILPIILGVVGAFTAMQIVSTIIGLITGVATALALILSPAGLVVVAIAAVIAIGVTLYKNWDKICQWAGKLKETVSKKWNDLKAAVSNTVENLKKAIKEKWDALKTAVSDTVNGIKTAVTDKWNSIKEGISDTITSIKEGAAEKFNAFRENAVNAFENFKESAGDKLTAADEKVREVMGLITGRADFEWNLPELGDTPLETAQNAVEWFVDGILDIIGFDWELPEIDTSIIDNAIDFVSGAIDTIKGLLDFDWSFPDIKLPHFSWEWKDIGGIVSVPSISVEWYAKGGIIDGASLIGAGEAGPEAIIPLSGQSKMRPFAEAIADEMEAGRGDSEVVALLKEYLPLLASMQMVLDSGRLVGELAPAMDARLGIISARKGRGN